MAKRTSPLTLDDYGDCLNWNNGSHINSLAFHFVATICKGSFYDYHVTLSSLGPNETNNVTKNATLEASIEAPATFFVQMFRFGLSLTFVIIILALYNRWGRLGSHL